MTATSSHSKGAANFLVRYWRGEGPLWKIYWLYGVLVSFALGGFYAAALYAGALLVQQALLPVLLLYTVWIVVSVWRCADNASKELYSHLARGLTVAWALNALMLLGALQLDLLSSYLT